MPYKGKLTISLLVSVWHGSGVWLLLWFTPAEQSHGKNNMVTWWWHWHSRLPPFSFHKYTVQKIKMNLTFFFFSKCLYIHCINLWFLWQPELWTLVFTWEIFFSLHPVLLPMHTPRLVILLHLTSSFAAITISRVTSGHRQYTQRRILISLLHSRPICFFVFFFLTKATGISSKLTTSKLNYSY